MGLSDTFTGAFWVADALFAFANAGASGFHLHWGKGGEPGGNSQPNTGVQTNFNYVSWFRGEPFNSRSKARSIAQHARAAAAAAAVYSSAACAQRS